MDEFEIPVTYKGNELSFPAKLQRYGYIYKIAVDINGSAIFFERDEEGNWRALIAYEEVSQTKQFDKELLTAIAEVLDEVTK